MTMTVLRALWGPIKQFGTRAIKQEQNDARLVPMARTLILGTLFASLLMNSAWAQNKNEPPKGGPPYPGGSEISFQWNYSCPSVSNCSFTCMGAGGASHATKLAIYLGTIPLGDDQSGPALLYEFSTREIPRGNGFIISAGISTLSCQINGFALDYSGPPTERRTFEISDTGQNNKK
jgi:hypothetical protein